MPQKSNTDRKSRLMTNYLKILDHESEERNSTTPNDSFLEIVDMAKRFAKKELAKIGTDFIEGSSGAEI